MIVSRRNTARIGQLKEEGYNVIDVTSNSSDSFVKFSPFYPHGNIPVPGMRNVVAESVEGIWQGLKVFETKGIDTNKFNIKTMKNIKRVGRPVGHQYRNRIIGYVEARNLIYVPSYEYVLDAYLQDELDELRCMDNLVLLDYETNDDINDTSQPLSHASLILKAI